MDPLLVRFEDEDRAALRTAAAGKGIPEAEIVRRLVRRGLAIAASDAQAQELAEAVRAVVRAELRKTHHYAWLAAREAAASHRYGIGLLSVLLGDIARWPADRCERVRDQAESGAMRYAAQHLQDREPDDLALDAPAEPLPGPEDEVTVEDGDTASMIEGA